MNLLAAVGVGEDDEVVPVRYGKPVSSVDDSVRLRLYIDGLNTLPAGLPPLPPHRVIGLDEIRWHPLQRPSLRLVPEGCQREVVARTEMVTRKDNHPVRVRVGWRIITDAASARCTRRRQGYEASKQSITKHGSPPVTEGHREYSTAESSERQSEAPSSLAVRIASSFPPVSEGQV